MNEIEAIKKMLKAYAVTPAPVSQKFYQGLCLKAIETIEKLQTQCEVRAKHDD